GRSREPSGTYRTGPVTELDCQNPSGIGVPSLNGKPSIATSRPASAPTPPTPQRLPPPTRCHEAFPPYPDPDDPSPSGLRSPSCPSCRRLQGRSMLRYPYEALAAQRNSRSPPSLLSVNGTVTAPQLCTGKRKRHPLFQKIFLGNRSRDEGDKRTEAG